MRLVITVRLILAEPASLGSGPVVEVCPGRIRESRGRRVAEPLIQCVQIVVQPAGQLTGRDRADVVTHEHLMQDAEHEARCRREGAARQGYCPAARQSRRSSAFAQPSAFQTPELVVRPRYDILREPGQADAGTRIKRAFGSFGLVYRASFVASTTTLVSSGCRCQARQRSDRTSSGPGPALSAASWP
jgi:hypothetical protein